MKKTFDCVELQHRGGDRIRVETAGMTVEELVALWKRRTDALLEFQRAARERRARAQQPPQE